MRAAPPSTASTNLTVVNGTSTNSLAGTVLTINATDRTVLSWSNFWDGTTAGGTASVGDVINYVLPSSSASVLNQVTSGTATTMSAGEITSNGRVFLVNPAGITIGSNAIINAASFGASAVSEPLAYYEANGTLSAFGNGFSSTSAGTVYVQQGATITTIGGSGNVYLAGGSSTGGTYLQLSANITGNAYLYGQGGSVEVGPSTITSTPTSAGPVGGNLTIVNQASAANSSTTYLGYSGTTIVQGNLAVSTNGGQIYLSDGSNTTVTGNAVIDSSGLAFNGNINYFGGYLLVSNTGSTTLINSATETTAGVASTGNPSTGTPGTINVQGDFAGLSVIGGNTTIYDPTANNLNLGTANVKGTYSATSNLGSITNSGTIAVTGAITLSASTAGKTITFVGTGVETFGGLNVSSTGAVTLTSSGTITLPSGASIPTLTVTSTGGAINESGAITSSGTTTLSAATGINLDTFVNSLTKVVLLGAPSGTFIDNSGSLTVLTGTATTGASVITVGNGSLTFGTAAADTIAFGGSLGIDIHGGTANANTVATVANNLTVAGPVSIYGNADNVVLGTAASTTSSFGQISGTGLLNVTIYESQSTNLGGTFTFTGSATTNNGGNTSLIQNQTGPASGPLTVTGLTTQVYNPGGGGQPVSGNLVVVSGGNISNPSKVISVAGTTALTAGTTSAPGSIQIGTNTSGNIAALTGTITDGLSSSLTLVNSLPTTVAVSTGGGAFAATVLNGGALNVSFAGTNAGFTSESFTMSGGNVNLGTDPVAVTIQNSTTTATNASVAVAANGTITLGAGVNLLNTGGNTFTTNGTGSNIVDSAGNSFNLSGATTFNSSGSILLNSGTANSAGEVFLNLTSASGNGNIAYTEGFTVNLGGISITNATSTGSVTITANTGSIIESNAISLASPALSGVTFSAVNGAVTLNTFVNTIGSTTTTPTVPISILASTASALTDSTNVLLGNVTVSGAGLSVQSTGGTESITQAAGTSTFILGASNFSTANGAITLTNSGNNFGAITVQSFGGNVSIREYYTNNYAGVSTGTGNFTAVDDVGNIIETSAASFSVGGKTSLTATLGSIILTNTTNSLDNGVGATLFLSSSGSASVTDSSTTTTLLDGTKVGGALTLTNTAAGGTIQDSGNTATISVTGQTSLLATGGGASKINFTGTNSSFGALLFKAGTGTSVFTENASSVLIGGSIVTGPMTITSGGSISTSGAQTSTFSSSLRLNALGSITISTPINVAGGLTVDAIAGPTNLSAESLSTNLSNTAPTNLGNATNYTGPGQ